MKQLNRKSMCWFLLLAFVALDTFGMAADAPPSDRLRLIIETDAGGDPDDEQSGYNDTQDAVDLIIAAVDRPDPRPIWYSDWGTDHGAATNNLRRALDRVLHERGADGYAQFKSKLRLSSYDAFGEHTAQVAPPFPLWVNTFQPASGDLSCRMDVWPLTGNRSI